MSSIIAKDWSMSGVWNSSLVDGKKETYDARDYLWASELGKAPVDTFLRLNGTHATNPPNMRSKRKFEAGNVFEWVIKLVLQRAGILIDSQVHCAHQYPGLMKVTGRCDFIAGGIPDFARAVAELKALDMPEMFIRAAEAMKLYFEKEYPGGLMHKPIEVKSLSGMMFEGLLARNQASINHRMQLFHYLKSMGYEKGTILYVCRDDLRIMEVTILNGGVFEDEYKSHITTLSEAYYSKVQPKIEEPIIYDPDVAKFTANWRVGYSMYLTLLYGLADQAEFDGKFKKTPARWNRVLTRFRESKKMTPKNLEALVEIQEAGFDIATIAMVGAVTK